MNLRLFTTYPSAIIFVGFVFFSRIRVSSYLHIYQQEEYDSGRFLRWLIHTRSIDRTASIGVLLAFAASAMVPTFRTLIDCLLAAALVAIAERERRYQKSAKKPMVMTSRAQRISNVSWLLAVLSAGSLSFISSSIPIWILAIHACPLYLVASNFLLSPIERRIKAKYWNEAHDKLAELRPQIIGITGSFGKTSVKHILGHILQFHSSTLITPGSVNTEMGIARIIREQLRASHKFFIVEMGAYGLGSIERLCKLAPPQLGILTAIGAAHLERFRSKETTATAKMELATAVRANNGRMIINEELLQYAPVRKQYTEDQSAFVTCGTDEGDVAYERVEQTRDGLNLTIRANGKTFLIASPLHGRHQGLNIALAFAAASQLGVQPQDIVTALRSVPQISHRLEVRKQSDGTLLIDDAYNSNPGGFESALNLLVFLKSADGKSYLVTPGMVELGADHDTEHFRLGQMAGEMVDVLLCINAARIPTFVEGFRKGSHGGKDVFIFDTFYQAQAALKGYVQPHDVVLIENDLPDLYERPMLL